MPAVRDAPGTKGNALRFEPRFMVCRVGRGVLTSCLREPVFQEADADSETRSLVKRNDSPRRASPCLEISISFGGEMRELPSQDILFNLLIPAIGNIPLEPRTELLEALRRQLLHRFLEFCRAHDIIRYSWPEIRSNSVFACKGVRGQDILKLISPSDSRTAPLVAGHDAFHEVVE